MKHLPELYYKPVAHKSQRYDTAGDYQKKQCECGKKHWMFNVSKMEKPEYELLVLIHELYEWFTTQQAGIKEETITLFDTAEVGSKYQDDPGRDPKAPYHLQHMQATKLEQLAAKLLGIDWKEYDESFKRLKY